VAGEDFGLVEACPRAFEHVEFFDDLCVGFVAELFADLGIGEVVDGDGGAVCAADGALEEMRS
jgi:hypothetical protein